MTAGGAAGDGAVDTSVAAAALLSSLLLIVAANLVAGGALTLGQLALVQIVCIAGPGLLAGQFFGRDGMWRATGFWRPGWRSLAGAALLGASFWVLLVWLVVPLSVQIFGLREAAQLSARWLGGDTPLGWRLLAIALVPAVAEEILFRGVLARSLAARHGQGAAVAISALVFAAYHLSPARLLPTLALGAVLAWVVLRSRSIWPGMIVHGLGNAAAVLVAQHPPASRWLTAHETLAGTLALVIALLGAWLLAATPSEPTNTQ